MPQNIEDWSEAEFIAYLLLYVSYADLEFSDDERAAIAEYVDKETFADIKDFQDRMGDFERLDFIVQAKPYFFPTEERKSALLKIIFEHCHIDGEFSKLESNLYEFLKRIL